MKRILLIAFISLILINMIGAQTNEMPTFSSATVVMKVCLSPNAAVPSYVTMDDGTIFYSVELNMETFTFKKEQENNNSRILAILINKLREQGYKFIGSSSGLLSGLVTYNYFQKD